MFPIKAIAILISMSCFTAVIYGDEVRYYRGDDGRTYQETRRIVQRPVITTEWKDRQRTSYRQELRQDVRDTWRTYYTPVTEHRWISRLHGRWNPFIIPYYTHHLLPVTHWESRAEIVKVPVWRTEWVPQTQTVRVPVTQQRMVESESVQRVAVSNPSSRPIGGNLHATPSAVGPTRIAQRPPYHYGGIALTSDPPRQATGWRPSGSTIRR